VTEGCIGEPVSWLRLEQLALGVGDAAADAHLSACSACRHCLEQIRGDAVALPPPPVVALAPRRAWWRWGGVGLGVAVAAAAVLVVVVRTPARDERVATVKGIGELVVGVVRERGGAIREDATTFLPDDRWKVVVTCPPDAAAWLDVAVVDDPARPPDYPVAPAHVVCGNRVVVPGAFVLTGTRANRVCAVAATTAPPERGSVADGAACITIRPE
jgi:hypothetical protein